MPIGDTRGELIRGNPVRAFAEDMRPIHDECEPAPVGVLPLLQPDGSQADLARDPALPLPVGCKHGADFVKRLFSAAVRPPELGLVYGKRTPCAGPDGLHPLLCLLAVRVGEGELDPALRPLEALDRNLHIQRYLSRFVLLADSYVLQARGAISSQTDGPPDPAGGQLRSPVPSPL